jgi:hypothetical protein
MDRRVQTPEKNSGGKSERQALGAKTERSTDDALCKPKQTDASKSPGRMKTRIRKPKTVVVNE